MRHGATRYARATLWVYPLLACLVIVGCGQKGPLVLPDKQKHAPVVPTPATTPAATVISAPASAPAQAPSANPAPAP